MIKEGKKVFLLGMLILALVLAGCNSDDGVEQLSATAANFDEVFNSIKAKPGNYVINLTGDLIDYTGTLVETAGVNITVKGTGSNKITWKHMEGKPPLFLAKAGKISFENISLSRSPGNTNGRAVLVANGGTIEIKNGVVLSSNNGSQYFNGVWIDAGAFIMSGGTIENCGVGVSTDHKGVSITVSGGTIRSNKDCGIALWSDSENCTVTISGGTISGSSDRGVAMEGTGNKFTMSGGIIENCGVGVGTGEKSISFTILGGTIRNNTNVGIGIWDDSENCVVTISGGTIDNCNNGVSTSGKGTSITVSGGIISNNSEAGIVAWDASKNCVATISGGTISGNGNRGVMVVGTGGKLTMSGGTITGGAGRGVVIGGTGTKFTMSGGTIGKNGTWGLNIAGADIEFEKRKGAVIYGNSGDNKNNEGAIWVNTRGNPANDLKLLLDAGKDDVYAIKTNSGNTDIVAGSKQGPNW
jgi:hypothetical protein